MKQGSTVIDRHGAVVGLDLSDKRGTFVVLDWRGQVVTEGEVMMSRGGLQRCFGSRRYRIAIEAGTHSPWVSRELTRMGHEVIVADPRQVPYIYRNQRKNDRLDAFGLAKLARLDPELLSPIVHRSEQAQAHLASCARVTSLWPSGPA